MDLSQSAQRFELGGRQSAGVAGQIACLRWLEETVTYRWVFERISFLNKYVYEAVNDIPGMKILTPDPGASGLLACALDATHVAPIIPWLQQEYDIHVCAIFEYNAFCALNAFLH